jgi:hypothetical protein
LRLTLLAGQRDSAPGGRRRVGEAPREHIAVRESGQAGGMSGESADGSSMLVTFLEEGDAIGEAPGPSVGEAKVHRHRGQPVAEPMSATQGERLLQQTDTLPEVAPAEMGDAQEAVRRDLGEAIVACLGDLHGLAAHRERLVELPEVLERPCQPGAGAARIPVKRSPTLPRHLTFERAEADAVARRCLTKLSPILVRRAEEEVRRGGQVGIAHVRRQRKGAAARLDGLVHCPGDPQHQALVRADVSETAALPARLRECRGFGEAIEAATVLGAGLEYSGEIEP